MSKWLIAVTLGATLIPAARVDAQSVVSVGEWRGGDSVPLAGPPVPSRLPASADGIPPRARDPVRDGAGRGALLGAAAAMALGVAQMTSCDTGCDWSSTGGLLVGWALLGGGIGSMVGLAADYDTSLPGRPSVRFGVGYTGTTMQSAALSGRAATPMFGLGVQLSRHVSVRVEYLPIDALFRAAPGAIPEDILNNIVVANSRRAGWSHGVESLRVDYILSELVGVGFEPWTRVRVELLGGLGVQGEEERSYYDAYTSAVGGASEPIPGKYYVLEFVSPQIGAVVGIDAEVTIVGGLSVVPTLRYHAMGSPSASIAFGAGAHWRF